MATTYTLINSNVLTSTAASVTFSSIPATYTDLVLRVSARSGNTGYFDYIKITFNSDTATNYSLTRITANSTTAASLGLANQNDYGNSNYQPASTATANTFNSFEMYIPNYLSTSNKPMSGVSMLENNNATSYYVSATANLYRGSSAVSSITLTSANGDFQVGSSFYLYGISNA